MRTYARVVVEAMMTIVRNTKKDELAVTSEDAGAGIITGWEISM